MNVTDIKDYIIAHYPDSCLAYNYTDSYSEEQLIEVCEEFFYYEKLKWCGCGDPDTAKQIVKNYLTAIKNRRMDNSESLRKYFNVRSVYDNDLLLCLAYTIDAAEFTEHGTSIGGAWLTDTGEMFLWLLNHNKSLDEQGERE